MLLKKVKSKVFKMYHVMFRQFEIKSYAAMLDCPCLRRTRKVWHWFKVSNWSKKQLQSPY